MKPPLIVSEHGDVMVFETAEHLEQKLEPPDVLNDEYVAYDSEGRRLSLQVADHRVRVSATEAEPSHADELREVLANFLTRTGHGEGRSALSLSGLVDALVHAHGYSR